MLEAGERVPRTCQSYCATEKGRPTLRPLRQRQAGNRLPSKGARAAHSVESQMLLAIPVAETTLSIVPCSTRIGLLSLPEVPGSGSTFVEPASCKAKLDNEPSLERAGLCTRSRKS